MKRQIRTNVFETNSSSMHSLVVMKQDERMTEEEIRREIYVYKDGEWSIWGSLYYGRSPFNVLATIEDKFKYAMASMVKEYKDDVFNELFAIIQKYIPELKRIGLKTEWDGFYNKDKYSEEDWQYKYAKTEEEMEEYIKALEKKWGVEEGYIDWYYDDYEERFMFKRPYTGGVDEDILSNFLEKENITLEEFLINKKYVVIVDGDEYCIYKTLKENGLINEDAIDHEY